MRRVSLFLSPGLLAGLKAVKERDGVPAAESIRRAINAYLVEKGVKTNTEKTRKAKR